MVSLIDDLADMKEGKFWYHDTLLRQTNRKAKGARQNIQAKAITRLLQAVDDIWDFGEPGEESRSGRQWIVKWGVFPYQGRTMDCGIQLMAAMREAANKGLQNRMGDGDNRPFKGTDARCHLLMELMEWMITEGDIRGRKRRVARPSARKRRQGRTRTLRNGRGGGKTSGSVTPGKRTGQGVGGQREWTARKKQTARRTRRRTSTNRQGHGKKKGARGTKDPTKDNKRGRKETKQWRAWVIKGEARRSKGWLCRCFP